MSKPIPVLTLGGVTPKAGGDELAGRRYHEFPHQARR